MAVPRLAKVVVSMGTGSPTQDKNRLPAVMADLALAGGYRHRRVAYGTGTGAAARADARPVGEVAKAEIAAELGLVVALVVEEDHAVDLAGLDGGVAQGRPDRLAGDLSLAPPDVLAELGLADADDGGPVADHVSEARHGSPLRTPIDSRVAAIIHPPVRHRPGRGVRGPR